jgi:hypothetical protein
MRHPIAVCAILLTATTLTGACSGDDGGRAAGTTTTSPSSTLTTIASQDPTLAPLLVTVADLGTGYAASDNVADTITAFCAGEDATAGLQARGRAITGFTRTPPGASVIHVVFQFEDDGAAAFVRQATEILQRCSGVPDATGLAFEYGDPAANLVTLLAAGTDASVTRHGVSVGSGSLQSSVAVFHRGDIGELVAVLAVDQPRALVDALATTAFTAAVAHLTAAL